MQQRLDEPSSDDPDEIYLIRGAQTEFARPLLTGDIFSDVEIPGFPQVGDDADSMVMLIGHPCAMRRGPVAEPRVQAARVVPYEKVPSHKWPVGHFAKFPLPGLLGSGKGARHFAVDFDVTGMVDSSHLLLDKRLACLSERGIHLLQQRVVFHLTRVVVPIEHFDAYLSPVLEEAELQDEWNSSLVPLRTDGGEDLDVALAAESAGFHEFMRAEDHIGGVSLQVALDQPHRRAEVRRRVQAEIEARKLVASINAEEISEGSAGS